MTLLRKLASNPAFLLLCLMAGALLGWLMPTLGGYATFLGQVYLAVVSMAALPLLVVATFFGLRQTLALPQPALRVLMIAGLGALLVVLCAVIGTAAGVVAQPGSNLDRSTRAYLGGLVDRMGGDAANAEMPLLAPMESAPEGQSVLADLIPDNFFRALAEGNPLGILLCAILFGLAFAALSKTQNNALTNVFEATYRALEIIISRVNLFIPFLVFGMAAYFSARTDLRTLGAMGGFIFTFVLVCLLMSVAAVLVVRHQADLPAGEVVSAIKVPALVALTSASTTASIPDTIDAMSNRLGFSRGIVELVTPISSVFMRAGAALYFALLAMFVANLYGREFSSEQLLLISAGATLAAFASSGHNAMASVGFAGIVLSMLQLPVEAALALFMAIDLICEGPRNLLSLLFACVLIALVSKGLPSERRVAAEVAGPAPPLQFSFTRSDLVVAGACGIAAALLIVVLGVGMGMKAGDNAGGRRVPASAMTEPAETNRPQ